MTTKIIYLIGKPGTGKYTIAQEFVKSGFIVCDNHLVNNPIFALLNYDGFNTIPEFAWESIAKIRNVIFGFLSIEKSNDYILTNCLFENDGDRELYSQVESMALKRGSIFVPVKLLISETEHLKRITEPSRINRLKSINPEDIYSEQELIQIDHKNYLELDVSNLSAVEAMERILDHVRMIA